MKGRVLQHRVRLAGQFAAVPLARWQGLESGGGHVEQHLAQVGAAVQATHLLVDGFAPAFAHAAAFELMHIHGALAALRMWNVVQRGGHVVNEHVVVNRQANAQAVDGLVCREGRLVGHLKGIGLDVGQRRFNVPKSIFTVIAKKNNGTGVRQASRGGGRQAHCENSSQGCSTVTPACAACPVTLQPL